MTVRIKLNLIPLSYWHEIKDLVVVFFKCLKGLSRSTRNNCPLDMSVPLYKTKLFQTSYFNRIPNMWNTLTPNIRCCSSVTVLSDLPSTIATLRLHSARITRYLGSQYASSAVLLATSYHLPNVATKRLGFPTVSHYCSFSYNSSILLEPCYSIRGT